MGMDGVSRRVFGRNCRIAVIASILGAIAVSCFGSDLSELVGYIAISTERIDDFDGCEYGKIIQLSSGSHVICREYGYQYAFYVDAVIFLNLLWSADGADCKMAVRNELYDISCDDYVRIQIDVLHTMLKQKHSTEIKTIMESWLRLFEGI